MQEPWVLVPAPPFSASGSDELGLSLLLLNGDNAGCSRGSNEILCEHLCMQFIKGRSRASPTALWQSFCDCCYDSSFPRWL